jgi:hypothetical protein
MCPAFVAVVVTYLSAKRPFICLYLANILVLTISYRFFIFVPLFAGIIKIDVNF